ncbi:MAG TPA: Lrp/AsnC family transcriptional regulator [Euryarchaeota archaeon]|nr:asnC family protein [archaeon BMS3Bbin15]HDL15759.1 Lrp/AsnC family transcriptional regulator [Euryarchaeota archaeon]
MVKGICLIKGEAEKSGDMKIRLEEMSEVKEVLQLFGDYDLITIIEASSLRELNETVDKIRSIKGIKETNTLIAAET